MMRRQRDPWRGCVCARCQRCRQWNGAVTHTRVSRKGQKLRRGKFIIFRAAFGDSTAPLTTDVSNVLTSKTVRVNV